MTAALARLQIDALRLPAGHEPHSVQAAAESSPRAEALAVAAGFTVLGRGTSRIALAVDGGAAKVAHNVIGLALNLQEAACWLAFPDELRLHLTPCLSLSPELVLTQERVDVIGPALMGDLNDAWLQEREAARRHYADRIIACREELGLGTESKLRLNNFGLHDGRVVMVDYGDQFPPLPQAWERLIGVARPTGRDLAERAGLNAENTDACPCYCGGTFDAGDRATCGLDDDLADYLRDVVTGERSATTRT